MGASSLTQRLTCQPPCSLRPSARPTARPDKPVRLTTSWTSAPRGRSHHSSAGRKHAAYSCLTTPITYPNAVPDRPCAAGRHSPRAYRLGSPCASIRARRRAQHATGHPETRFSRKGRTVRQYRPRSADKHELANFKYKLDQRSVCGELGPGQSAGAAVTEPD